MTSQLPARPNLEQLKRQTKDPLRAAHAKDTTALARFHALPALGGKSSAELAQLTLALHDAQSVVAREHGFPSWNALRERVDELTLKFDEAVAAFSRGSVEQRLTRAERILALHPNLVAANFHAALAFGDSAAVAKHLAHDPALATRRGGPLDWEPLLYVAHSHWAGKNSAGLVATTRLLLENGADPNTSYPFHGDPKQTLSALYAAACHARHFALAQLLLGAGAKPDDGESVYHAAENGDVAMLELLAAHGAQVDGGAGGEPWGNTPLFFILGHCAGMSHDANVRRGAEWLLAHGADPNRVCYPDKSAETPLHAAARHWDAAMIDLLLARGANIHVRRKDGRTPLTLALINGRSSAADALRRAGALDELTPEEQFIAACLRGDRDAALRLRNPAFIAAQAGMLAEAVGRPAVLELMLECGFDPKVTDQMGATPLHWAAFTGNAVSARVLLANGAPVDVRDRTYHADPLGWCDYAELNRPNAQGDYAGVARALLEAGAPLPSEEKFADWGSDVVKEVIAEFMRKGSG